MKIAIDISPLSTGHKVRGVGFYLTNLLESLEMYYPDNTFHSFEQGQKLPDDIDVVHIPYFDPFFRTLPFQFGRPTVVTVHDLIPLKFPDLFPAGKKGKLNWHIQKRLLRKAEVIITDSHSSRADIQSILHIPPECLQVVYLAPSNTFKKMHITEEAKNKFLKKYDLPDRFVLYVGDVTANKNLPTLIKSIEIAEVPLVLVGKTLASESYDREHPWNKDLVTVKNLMNGNSLFHAVGFVPTDDLVMLYNLTSVFVMPSFYEGFGLPLVEAMSCGAPVITTKESSLPEVGGDAAAYVDYKNPDEFAEKIKMIIKDKELASDMSKKSLEQAGKFSWEKTAAETMSAYRKAVGR